MPWNSRTPLFVKILGVIVFAGAVGVGHCETFDCDFIHPSCGWTWSDGFTLLSVENSSLLGDTAPQGDAENSTKGLFLYYSAPGRGQHVVQEIVSPEFYPGTKQSCALELSLHMYNMNEVVFKVIVKAPNSTWETTSFLGNSAHRWETQKERIGLVSQPFNIILEFIDYNTALPSHVAIDNLQAVDCYDRKYQTTDCAPRQYQCSDMICVDASEVCDLKADCVYGDDEMQDCDQIPEAASCTFQKDSCTWTSDPEQDGSVWIRIAGESPNQRTGPSFDHTFQNESGFYMMAKFPPGRSFGKQAVLTSPIFEPPPVYHRNPHSLYFNSCEVRFFYHKYGHSIGDLRLYSLEIEPSSTKPKAVELWRSYGNKGDFWRQAVVPLPNISHRFYIQFTASRGVSHSDIAIDDVSLSPECFGIGVPENESLWIPPDATERPTDVMKPKPHVKRYVFGTCEAKGRFGPNATLCMLAYNKTNVVVTVGAEPGMEGVQKWTIPENGVYTIFARGAGGGNGVANRGKTMGSFIRATFQWTTGEVIYILVGQKGTSACSEDSMRFVGQLCDRVVVKRDIRNIYKLNQERKRGGGGGGGGASYIFKIDPVTSLKIPIAVAGGGGGLSSLISENTQPINPNGMGLNNSIAPINGYSGPDSGGGGGWDDTTTPGTSGYSLREGGTGGSVCLDASIWNTHGGFGGGGGGCASGGGGGGYRGGDASPVENPHTNGMGGTSYLINGVLNTLIEPGVNEGDGSVIVIPAQPGCGCEYQCILLDLDSKAYKCICPVGVTLNDDGFSCNGDYADGVGALSVPPKIIAMIILSAILVVASLGICTHFGVNRFRKRQNPTHRDGSQEILNNNHEEQLSRLRSAGPGGMVTEYNPNYEFGGTTCTVQDLREVPREHLTLVKALGQGAFGEVYQGYLRNPADNSERPVAVKTLPELSSSNQAEMDFLMEALIMSKFNHPNIVSFIGVCFEKMPRFIVLELLAGGDLKSFLRERRPKPQKPSSLTVSDLLKLAMDVAKGCQYLEENHFIHRDIAARNCLLTTKDASNRVVKIADFGMARDIYGADYYRKGGKAMLPVKWMPPEAFLDGIFTSKTDIWSFGVLLWEVISLGYMPYPGRGNQEVMQLVTSGGRLEPPTNCPSPVYHIMMQCWHPLPDERPNFITIIERLGYCLQDPDVINAPLPVFNRAPSMERDATVMRPNDDDSGGCLQVQRPDPNLLLSPGSEDYLIPMPHSTYSMTTERTDLQSSPGLGSADQLLELEDRRGGGGDGDSPASKPSTCETNFMTPDTPTTTAAWTNSTDHLKTSSQEAVPLYATNKGQNGYAKIPAEDDELDMATASRIPNGPKKAALRQTSIKSLDDLPMAPGVVNENDNKLKAPTSGASTTNHSNLSLDPSALARQMANSCSNPVDITQPRRYMNVDVNFNTGDSNTSLSLSSSVSTLDQNIANRNSVVGPFEGFAGVNPVA